MQNKEAFIPTIIDRYKSSADFLTGLEANAYFRGENSAIMAKEMLKADVVKAITKDELGREKVTKSLNHKSVIGNRASNNFLFRFVVQQNQLLLGNGVTLRDSELKKKLGRGFDTKLQQAGEDSLLHGVAWGYWNYDHLEFISSVKDAFSGFVPLYDEITGRPMVGIQFWQIDATKPMGVRLFEQDGVTVYKFRSIDGNSTSEVIQKKRAYKTKTVKDLKGEQVIEESNYSMLPVVPLYANSEKRSEFTHNIKSKIDMYDRIISDFGDNLERANDVYWVLNNFGGTTDDVIEMIDQINKIKAVINQSNAVGGGATAEPRTIEVPYAARSAALELLKKSLYQDYMALDMDEIRGGSLTNVAIRTATANLNLKADRFEWQCFEFVQNILLLVGAPEDELESISFNRRSITNDTETIQNIYAMRDDVTLEWALKNNPMVNPDDVKEIVAEKTKEKQEAEEKANQLLLQKQLIAEASKAKKGANGDDVQEAETGQPEQAQNGQEEREVTPPEPDKQ